MDNKEKRIREVFSNRLRGFETPPDGEQLIVDVISIFADKSITVEMAESVLRDASRIIKITTEV